MYINYKEHSMADIEPLSASFRKSGHNLSDYSDFL